MTDLENMLNSNKAIICIHTGSYSSILLPYSEALLTDLLNAVEVSTSYDKVSQDMSSESLKLTIVKSDAYKKAIQAKIESRQSSEQI